MYYYKNLSSKLSDSTDISRKIFEKIQKNYFLVKMKIHKEKIQ